MSQIQLQIVGDQVKVVTPYNSDFVFRAKRLRGKWKDGAWWFDESLLEYVRDLMVEFFGTTGEKPYEKVTLLVKDFSSSAYGEPVILFNRTIAKASGRHSGAKMGDDVFLIKGSFDSGGSMRNWSTRVSNATFEIHNFPEPALEMPEVAKAIEEGWVEVKKATKRRPKEEIESEIKQLQNRIVELINELGYDS